MNVFKQIKESYNLYSHTIEEPCILFVANTEEGCEVMHKKLWAELEDCFPKHTTVCLTYFPLNDISLIPKLKDHNNTFLFCFVQDGIKDLSPEVGDAIINSIIQKVKENLNYLLVQTVNTYTLH